MSDPIAFITTFDIQEGMKRFAPGEAVLTVPPRLAGFDRFGDAARGAP